MYLLDVPRFNLSVALGVVIALLLAGHLASRFYQRLDLTRNLAVTLILVETIGIALLLIPTGGLSSPFIWYSLNPILMAALMLAIPYCWLVLTVFLGAATLGSVLLFGESLQEVWAGRSWAIAAFIMITAGASVFSYLMAALRRAYTQLDAMHRQTQHLLVVQEQNRIANEIHDGVSQHLFSIVCALHSLRQRNSHIQDRETQEQLQLISQTATRAAQELRASIYRIKPSANSGQAFITALAAQLDDIAKLNDVRINLETTGNEDAVSPALRQAITRIVKEAVANAIRHGRCSTVDIELAMQPGSLAPEIQDDGIGFDPQSRKHGGLGLGNMASLAANFNGSLEVKSAPGEGTYISMVIIVLLAAIGTGISGRPFLLSVIRSYSMYPLLSRGDLVLIAPVGSQQSLHTGDIVLFKTEKGNLANKGWVIHRIVGGNEVDGYITQGDNNGETDQENGGAPPIKRDWIASRALTIAGVPIKVPLLGYIPLWVEQFQKNTYSFPLIGLGLALILAASELVPDGKRRRSKRESKLDKAMLYVFGGTTLSLVLTASMLAASQNLTLLYEVSDTSRGILMGSDVGILPIGEEIERPLVELSNKTFLPVVSTCTTKDRQISFSHDYLYLLKEQKLEASFKVSAQTPGKYESKVWVGMFFPFLPAPVIYWLAKRSYWLALFVVALIPALPIISYPLWDSTLRRQAGRELSRSWRRWRAKLPI